MASLKKWILIVDDEKDIVEIMQNVLELNFGEVLKVVTASDGLEATNKLHFQAFDCIVTDLSMPRKDGEPFIESARHTNLNAHTPIVVVTGNAEKFPEGKFKHIHLMEKPIDTDKLVSLIGTQIKLGRTNQRLEAHLLNSFITATITFLDKLVKEEAEQQNPRPKKSGDTIENEVIRQFTIKSGDSKTKFVMGFTKEILEALAKSVNGGATPKDYDYEHLAGAAGSIIIKRALKALEQTNLSILESESYVNGKHIQEYKALRNEKGLSLPIATKFGEIEVHALW